MVGGRRGICHCNSSDLSDLSSYCAVSGSQATAEWCRTSCCNTAGCVAFVFVTVLPGDGRPFCFLKVQHYNEPSPTPLPSSESHNLPSPSTRHFLEVWMLAKHRPFPLSPQRTSLYSPNRVSTAAVLIDVVTVRSALVVCVRGFAAHCAPSQPLRYLHLRYSAVF